MERGRLLQLLIKVMWGGNIYTGLNFESLFVFPCSLDDIFTTDFFNAIVLTLDHCQDGCSKLLKEIPKTVVTFSF